MGTGSPEPGSGPGTHRRRPATIPLDRSGDGTFSGGSSAGARATATDTWSTAGAVPRPGLRFQPEGVHGPSEVVDPGRFAWTDAGWRGLEPEDGWSSTSCTSARSAPRGRSTGRPSGSPTLRDLGVTADRADAGRRLRRAAELGLRRRRPVRPVARLRPPRRPPAAGRRRPPPRAWRSSSTWSTTTSGRSAITPWRSAPTTSPKTHSSAWAACVNLDGEGREQGPRVLHRERPATGSTSTTSTASGSTPPTP